MKLLIEDGRVEWVLRLVRGNSVFNAEQRFRITFRTTLHHTSIGGRLHNRGRQRRAGRRRFFHHHPYPVLKLPERWHPAIAERRGGRAAVSGGRQLEQRARKGLRAVHLSQR